MKPLRTPLTRLVLAGATTVLLLGSCSSSKKTTDTTVAKTTAAGDTTAAAETSAAAAKAAAENNPASDAAVRTDTTAVTDTSAASDSTGAAASGPLTPERVTGAFTKMGIEATPADVACVVREGGSDLDLAADNPPPQFMKAIFRCVPAAMAKSVSGGSVDSKLAAVGITTTQAQCFLEKTFRVIGAKDVATVGALLKVNKFQEFPEDVRNEATAQGKTCGLSDKQIAALIAA